MEREPQQRQRQQHEQDEQPLRLAGAGRRMTALSPLFHSEHPLFSMERLYAAYRQCRRRKRRTCHALAFESRLEENLFDLRDALVRGHYRPEPSTVFMVEKPKRREIFAATFRDRVVHHLVVGALEPAWEKRFIHDSFACRKGKGTHRGVERVQTFARQVTCNATRTAWYLQLDIRGFFMSIDRHILLERLISKERDPVLVALIRTLVLHDPVCDCRFRKARQEDFLRLPAHKTLFKARPACGLPIGNLTSQFFANVYLDGLDQYVKHHLKARYYVRYCDDFVLLSHNRQELVAWQAAVEVYLKDRWRLHLNAKQRLRPVADGMDFLGYIVRPNYRLVRRRVVGSLHERLFQAEQTLRSHGMGRGEPERSLFPWTWPLLMRMQAWFFSYQGHLRHASSHRLWYATLRRFPWVHEYFVWHGMQPHVRFPPLRYVRRFEQQKQGWIAQFQDHVIMIQLGSFWAVTAHQPEHVPERDWYNQRFHKTALHTIKHRLWEARCPVAWIGETGRRIDGIAERVLIARWGPLPTFM